jgi:hypothetical protein
MRISYYHKQEARDHRRVSPVHADSASHRACAGGEGVAGRDRGGWITPAKWLRRRPAWCAKKLDGRAAVKWSHVAKFPFRAGTFHKVPTVNNPYYLPWAFAEITREPGFDVLCVEHGDTWQCSIRLRWWGRTPEPVTGFGELAGAERFEERKLVPGAIERAGLSRLSAYGRWRAPTSGQCIVCR